MKTLASTPYNPLGCYDLQILKNEKVLRRYKSSAYSAEECEDIAWNKHFSLFGIKRTKKDGILHCVSGKKKAWDRKGNFTQVDTCEDDIGSLQSIFMYRKNEGNGIRSLAHLSFDSLLAAYGIDRGSFHYFSFGCPPSLSLVL